MPTLRASLLIFLLLAPALAAQAAYKKWVDENGVVHYGTTIPPEYAQKGHTQINDRGIEVGTVERAKTPEEVARERELERLRAEQLKLEQEQRARDRVLLQLFSTEDDLIMVRDGKLQQVDAQIKLKQKQLDRLKDRLSTLQARAAAAERGGRKLNKKQQENLEATKAQIESGYGYIIDKEASKLRIAKHYDRDLERFRQLQRTQAGLIELEKPEGPTVISVPGAFLCKDADHCARLWPHAKQYAANNVNTKVELDSERIFMTQRARNPDEINVTLSRLSKRGVERIFLDLQCQDTVNGRKLCEQESVKSIQRDFITHLNGL